MTKPPLLLQQVVVGRRQRRDLVDRPRIHGNDRERAYASDGEATQLDEERGDAGREEWTRTKGETTRYSRGLRCGELGKAYDNKPLKRWTEGAWRDAYVDVCRTAVRRKPPGVEEREAKLV